MSGHFKNVLIYLKKSERATFRSHLLRQILKLKKKKGFRRYAVVDSLRTNVFSPYSTHTIIPVVANQAAGATRLSKAEIKGRIVEFAWHLKKQGYSEQTIKSYTINLKRLQKRGASLLDGESIKEVLAQQENWSLLTKRLMVTSYTAFANYNALAWSPPSYKPQSKLPFIPLESELDALIASAGKKLSTILQLLKETGMRIGEACKIRWIDIDLPHNVVTVNNPEKHGNPRMLKISNKLAAMLNALPKKERECSKPSPEMLHVGY